MRSPWIPFLLVALAACGPQPRPTRPEPSTAPSDEARDESEPSGPETPSEETGVTPTPTPPRRLVAMRDHARVELEEGTGFLVDATAPPPPPGSTPGSHPTLHGSCGGDPLGCSQAGNVVRPARTLDEVRAGLEALGFTVVIE